MYYLLTPTPVPGRASVPCVCGRLTDRQQSLNWLQLYWRAGRVIAGSDPLHTGFMVYDSFDIVTEKGVTETTGGFYCFEWKAYLCLCYWSYVLVCELWPNICVWCLQWIGLWRPVGYVQEKNNNKKNIRLVFISSDANLYFKSVLQQNYYYFLFLISQTSKWWIRGVVYTIGTSLIHQGLRVSGKKYRLEWKRQ